MRRYLLLIFILLPFTLVNSQSLNESISEESTIETNSTTTVITTIDNSNDNETTRSTTTANAINETTVELTTASETTSTTTTLIETNSTIENNETTTTKITTISKIDEISDSKASSTKSAPKEPCVIPECNCLNVTTVLCNDVDIIKIPTIKSSINVFMLEFTKVSVLRENAFENFNGTNITITGHNLTVIHEDTFKDCMHLKNLSLSNNRLGSLGNFKNLTNAIEKIHSLEFLDLSLNDLQFIPLKDKKYEKLHKLFLSGNKIEFLNESHKFWQTIIYIDLTNNLIKTINVDHRKDHSFKHVRHLILKQNQLSYVNSLTFKYFRALNILDLSENRLNSLFLLENEHMKSLNLSIQLNKRISPASNISKSFKLGSFSFYAHNKLDVLQRKHLKLSHNDIEEIDKRAFCVDRKKQSIEFHYSFIDLSGNPLKEIDSCTFLNLHRDLRNKTLLSLPLIKCNCHINNLKRFFYLKGTCYESNGMKIEMSNYNCKDFDEAAMCRDNKWEYDCDIDDSQLLMKKYLAAQFSHSAYGFFIISSFWLVAIIGLCIICCIQRAQRNKENNAISYFE